VATPTGQSTKILLRFLSSLRERCPGMVSRYAATVPGSLRVVLPDERRILVAPSWCIKQPTLYCPDAEARTWAEPHRGARTDRGCRRT
jgi:hypothetical protein